MADSIAPDVTSPTDDADSVPIFLVGMPGAGKTTIGKALARALERPFMDLDHELERRCGVRIPIIFDLEGEEGFRKREACALEECTRQPGIVLATGGGAVLLPENRRHLSQRGLVIYLKARPSDLYARTRHDRNRPLLQNADPQGVLARLLAARGPLYEEVADVVIETGRTSVAHLVRRVLPQVRYSLREMEATCNKST